MPNRTLDAMQPVIRASAEKLQAWLEARFASACRFSIIDGALDGERDELIALFDPRQRTGSFNNDITPTLRFNGTTVPLQRP
jgi:hypothetical protein